VVTSVGRWPEPGALTAARPDDDEREYMMTSISYHVTGLTCEHCTRAVSAELRALDGVTGVAVDLVPGGASTVTVETTAPLAEEAVAAALDEAGDYHLASPAGDDFPAVAPDQRLHLLP
jgi:copper chaperone CopZ